MSLRSRLVAAGFVEAEAIVSLELHQCRCPMCGERQNLVLPAGKVPHCICCGMRLDGPKLCLVRER